MQLIKLNSSPLDLHEKKKIRIGSGLFSEAFSLWPMTRLLITSSDALPLRLLGAEFITWELGQVYMSLLLIKKITILFIYHA